VPRIAGFAEAPSSYGCEYPYLSTGPEIRIRNPVSDDAVKFLGVFFLFVLIIIHKPNQPGHRIGISLSLYFVYELQPSVRVQAAMSRVVSGELSSEYDVIENEQAQTQSATESRHAGQAEDAQAGDTVSRPDSDLALHETADTTPGPQPGLTKTISRIPTATKPPSFSRLHEILFIMVITSSQLLTQAALAQSIAPLHVIGRTFNTTNPGQLSWFPAGYSLTVGTFILPAGRWGDLYGHKKFFVIGYFWFAVWSLVAGFSGFSRSLIFFAFCRAMQGIGPAIMLPNGIAVLSRTYPPGPRKDMVLSLFGATAPCGFLVGAVFSGIFTQFVWWPWAYWVLGIVCVLIGVMVIFVVPEMPVAGSAASLPELDLIGTAVGVAGLVLFNFAWNQGPAAGWNQTYVYVLLIFGTLLLTVFFWFEKYKAAFPLVPMSFFTRDTRLVFGCEAFGWASFGIWVFYLWYVRKVLSESKGY
jgi:MFS family permease